MKVAICTPCYGDPSYHYTHSLVQLLIYTAGKIDLIYVARKASVIAIQRTIIARTALEEGADWLLWLDADQTFPANTLERLLAAGKDVVGCNYPRREDPTGPTAANIVNGETRHVWTTLEKAQGGVLEEVSALGFGCILTSARAMRAVEAPQFRGELEDYYFCERAKEAGFDIWCDHPLSMHIGHVTEKVLTNVDVTLDRARFQMNWRNLHYPDGSAA